jgi:hypothetical protein
MFMRDKNGVQIVDVFADGRQSFSDLPPAQAGINQNPGALAGDKGGVSRTAARQYADFYDGILRLARPEVPAL